MLLNRDAGGIKEDAGPEDDTIDSKGANLSLIGNNRLISVVLRRPGLDIVLKPLDYAPVIRFMLTFF